MYIKRYKDIPIESKIRKINIMYIYCSINIYIEAVLHIQLIVNNSRYQNRNLDYMYIDKFNKNLCLLYRYR